HAAPQVFPLFTYLDMFERNTKNTRKYIMTTGKSREIFILNLEDKLRTDLLDLEFETDDSKK
ncbi:MAG: hypothetical protein U9O87_11130, partial [Verrucomicrobiota bacterium]|nr:hypothetical protein [Verrucomicrobiota bacterium]